MNQFFYNIATITWALKHVLFVIDYKVLTIHGEGKQRILLPEKHTIISRATVVQKRLVWFPKLSMRNSLLRTNGNVGKKSQNVSKVKM